MHTIDLVIIVGYLVAVVAAGAWFGRKQKTTTQYFLAGQHVPWWAISASIVATETSTITFISVPGIAYARGGDFTFLQLVFGYLLGRFVISLLFIPLYFTGDLVTVYQLLQRRFGSGVRGLASSLFVTMRTIADGVRLLLTAFVLAAVYGSVAGVSADSVITACVIGIGIVMIVFTFFGGMEAVVWIEVVQLGIYIFGAVAAGVVLAHGIPGGVHAAMEIGRQYDKFHLLDFTLTATKTFTFWAGLIGGCFLTMSTHGTDQYLVQRYLCTNRPRYAAMALLSSGAVILAQFIGFLFIGVLLFAFYHPYTLADYATGPAPAPFRAPDQVFPDFITRHLPSGLSGIVVAAIFAAAMSSSLNSIAAAFVADLYKPFRKEAGDKHLLNVSRVVTIIAGIAQIAVGLAVRHKSESALSTALSVASLINGPILGVFLLGSAKRGGPRSALVGMSCGLGVVLYLRFGTAVAWPWYTVVGSLVTLLIGTLASALDRRALRAGAAAILLLACGVARADDTDELRMPKRQFHAAPCGATPAVAGVFGLHPDQHEVFLHDFVGVAVCHLDELVKQAEAQQVNLTLYIEGIDSFNEPTAMDIQTGTVYFVLDRNAKNQALWRPYLYDPLFDPEVTLRISVGLRGERPLLRVPGANSFVTVTKLYVDWVTWLWLAMLFVIIAGVIYAAIYTDMLREGPRVNGARMPYSLGRTQMAWWFFMIVISFNYIWLVTSDRDTIPPSLLGLMGISAATALAAAAISPKSGAPAASRGFWQDLVSDERGAVALDRVQIVVWTIVLTGVFMTSVIWELTMPEFNATLLALMGISSGTYIGFKLPAAKREEPSA